MNTNEQIVAQPEKRRSLINGCGTLRGFHPRSACSLRERRGTSGKTPCSLESSLQKQESRSLARSFFPRSDNESFNFGAAYGVATFGSENAAITCGLGWGFAGDEFADEPIILLGGEFRASNSIKFISENWIPPNSDIVLFSFGVRFFGEQLAADLGLLTPLGAETEGFPFMPWIGFVYNFGIGK